MHCRADALRSTAKSWATGHRRPPISVLKVLRETVRARGLIGLEAALDWHIRKRRLEPKHRTSFWQIDPVTGQNKANRFGRPKRSIAWGFTLLASDFI